MSGVFLDEKDFQKIKAFLKGVVNLEVKEYSRKGETPVKEVILEYVDGKKMIGDLNSEPFTMKELTGLSSIAAYFARGKYGQTDWRGNCSGLLIKDLLMHFKPKFVIDPMAGSGTTGEVCRDLGIDCLLLDLNPKYGGFNALKDELPRSADFIFVHPPYFVFPGSNMPQYSGKMWGDSPHPDDGSWIQDEDKFRKWFNCVQANIYQGLRKGGRVCYLIGDSRFRGKYYSMFKNMDIYGDLESVIIKRQYNCMSDAIDYSGKFIPIQHEYLVIIRKNDSYIIRCWVVHKTEANILKSPKIHWRALIQSVIEELGGRATREDIYKVVKNHPKAKNNKHLKEKIRQVINSFPDEFIKLDNGYVELAA